MAPSGEAESDVGEIVRGDAAHARSRTGRSSMIVRSVACDRFDLHAEEAEGVDEVRADGAPDSAALFRIAPPVPAARPIASARTRVPHFGVANPAKLADALARGAERGEKAQLVIDERDLIGMLARRGDELLGLGHIQRRRFLAENVLAGVERGRGHLPDVPRAA